MAIRLYYPNKSISWSLRLNQNRSTQLKWSLSSWRDLDAWTEQTISWFIEVWSLRISLSLYLSISLSFFLFLSLSLFHWYLCVCVCAYFLLVSLCGLKCESLPLSLFSFSLSFLLSFSLSLFLTLSLIPSQVQKGCETVNQHDKELFFHFYLCQLFHLIPSGTYPINYHKLLPEIKHLKKTVNKFCFLLSATCKVNTLLSLVHRLDRSR